MIDMKDSAFKLRPQFKSLYFRSIGFRCWHAYTSNPEHIRISVSSSDKKNFIPWQTFNMELRAGTQVCRFKEKIKASSLKYIKLEIMSTHNAN